MAMPERKSDMVRRLVCEGNIKAALRIAKEFRLGITPDDRKHMQYGYECMVHPEFYAQLGRNVDDMVQTGQHTLFRLYGRREES